MPLEVHPAGDADMYRAAVLEREAYSPLKSNDILFPGDLPPGALDHRAEGLKEKCKEKGVHSFKVVDTELEEGEQMIAFAQWVVHDASNPLVPPEPRQFPPQVNAEACALLFNRLDQLRPKHMGDRPHLCEYERVPLSLKHISGKQAKLLRVLSREITVLALLLTHPKHQGRGAGTLLIRHCIEHGLKDFKLPIYLNASDAAHKLYLWHKFQDLELMETDFGKWGKEEPERAWAMIRNLGCK